MYRFVGQKTQYFLKIEKMPKIVLAISLLNETYGKINLIGICSHPINANRL